MRMDNCFIEVGSESSCKWGQRVSGDTFLSRRIKEEGRIVAVLSDGLGSGIKASVLSTLTATMALKYMENRMDIEKAASVIMKTLPVCKERRISYATFTIIDISSDLIVNVVEYDNPSLLCFSDKAFAQIDRKEVRIGYRKKHPAKMYISRIEAKLGDRLIFHSDGLNQSGMGKRVTPLGWGTSGVRNCISEMVENEPIISARSMAKQLVGQAIENDGRRSGDDTTCSVIYFRNPRALLVATGPPVDPANDIDLASAFRCFEGTKAICGGTTAKIIARELSKKVLVDLRLLNPEVPPLSIMDGVDLVTEGIITMSRSLEYLEASKLPTFTRTNAALQFANMLLDNDEINFIVGTKLNDANQMINNKAIEIRHTIVRKLATVLETRYLKKITVRFL
jgi:hypothetical protein